MCNENYKYFTYVQCLKLLKEKHVAREVRSAGKKVRKLNAVKQDPQIICASTAPMVSRSAGHM